MRTIIKRCNTIRLLERIANGIQNEDTAYAQRIRPLIEEWLNVTRFDMPTKSIAAKNGIANEIAALIDAGSLYPTARIEFRTSIGPQTPDSAATGTLLATLYFSYPAFKAAFNGVALANDIATDFSIESTGTPQYYRIYNRDGIAVFDGPVSTINGYAYGGVLGEIQFDNVNFLAGGVCSLTTLSITVP